MTQRSWQTFTYVLNTLISGEPSKLYDSTHPDWVPSRNMGHKKVGIVDAVVSRYDRAVERAAKRSCMSHDVQDPRNQNADSEGQNDQDSGTAVETSLTQEDLSTMEEKVLELESEKRHLVNYTILEKEKKEKDCEMDEDRFCDDDAKVSFYTGLPTWEILHILLQFLTPCLLKCSCLTPFQQVIMTLM